MSTYRGDEVNEHAMGAATPRARWPWEQSQVDHQEIQTETQKAHAVLEGSATFTMDELQRAVARLMLSG